MLTVRIRNRNKNPKDGRIAMPGEHDRHTSYSYVSVVINRPVPNAYINTHERGNCFFFVGPRVICIRCLAIAFCSFNNY